MFMCPETRIYSWVGRLSDVIRDVNVYLQSKCAKRKSPTEIWKIVLSGIIAASHLGRFYTII